MEELSLSFALVFVALLVGVSTSNAVEPVEANPGVISLHVKPSQDAFVLGEPIPLTLHFRQNAAAVESISLGEVGLSGLVIEVQPSDGPSFKANYQVREGSDFHSDNVLRISGVVSYGFLLDEFVVLPRTGRFSVTVSLKERPGLSATATFVIAEPGDALLAGWAKRAFDRQNSKGDRAEAGRILSRYWRPAAVPHLIELMKQFPVHGTDTMTIALESILRSDDSDGITWLWTKAATGDVPELRTHAQFIHARVSAYCARFPTETNRRIVKP